MKTKPLTKTISIIIIVAFLAVMVFPFFWILVTSFKPSSEIFGKDTAFNVIANAPTLTNYKQVIDKGILNSVKNSLIVASFTTLYVVAVATLSAYIIRRWSWSDRFSTCFTN
jgi:multiple sugar transport system permease protein